MMHLFDLDAIGTGLPVAAAHAQIERAAAAGALVVTAPPGTGKSTYVPPLVANLIARRKPSSGSLPRTLLTQPRRVAVRAAARRIAELDGSQLGGPVGFTVRGERQVSRATRIEALTPGVLLRRLLADPELTGVGAVILDEVHERSLDSDLLLGMLAEARALRDDLLLVAMSATLDAAGVAELLGAATQSGPAPIVEISSALHPLRIEHAPFEGARLDQRGVAREYLAHLARVTARAQAEARARDSSQCDALVFVPGAREVDEVVRLLLAQTERTGRDAIDVLALHGRISAREQDQAVRGRTPSAPPRIVVSTALAESSLTVPGVRVVIDSGLSREVRRDRAREMTGLVTVGSSRASAEQRAGRAARLGPGRAIRVYSETEFAHMPAASAPEIASADLTDAALLLAVWGTPGGAGLALPTPAPVASMRAAVTVLETLGITDASGHPTALGRRIAQLPIGVREARALLDGAQELGDDAGVAQIVAAVSDDFREPSADLGRLLRELRAGRAPGADRWRREAARLERLAGFDATENDQVALASDRSEPKTEPTTESLTRADPGFVVGLARPEWLARRTSEHSRSYQFASGTRAALPEGSALNASEWLAVREVQRAEGRVADGTGAVIRLAAAISADDAFHIGASLLAAERTARIESGRVRVRAEQRLGAILLSSTPAAARAEDTAPAFTAHLREVGLSAVTWSAAASSLRGRLALLHRELGHPWPDVDDAALLAGIAGWLGPDLERLRPDAALTSIDIASALRRLLPWPDAARLDQLVPEHLAVPSGSRVRIDYAPAGDDQAQPVVAVKLQEVFGLADTPRLVEGRVPILFHLLSPGRKPLAVTADLSSFWNGPYQDVRKEMRGRYPRHPWPEDPWSAPATARTTRRMAEGG